MDQFPLFNVPGKINLTVPLKQGFDKVLYQFLRLSILKSGLELKESERIAESISQLIAEKIEDSRGNRSASVEVLFTQGKGLVSIKAVIQQLNFVWDKSFPVSGN